MKISALPQVLLSLPLVTTAASAVTHAPDVEALRVKLRDMGLL